MRAFCGIKLRDICNESFKAPNSSSSIHVSTTNKKIGGKHCARVIVYSIVENDGINSAG